MIGVYFLSFLSVLDFGSSNNGGHLIEMVVLQFIFCLEISFGNVVVTVSKPLLEIYKFVLEASKFVTLVFS